MEHKYSNNAPLSQLEDTKSRFLESLGLGEDSFRELAQSGNIRQLEDQVVLSSQSGDMDLPGASNKNISIRAHSFGEVKVMASAVGHVPFIRPGAEVEKSFEDKATESEPEFKLTGSEGDLMGEGSISDNLLHVYCPKCDGELVIRAKHVGIEGACVWCDAAVITSRSSSNGEVNIYPVFRPGEVFEKNEPIVERALLPQNRQATLKGAFRGEVAPAPKPAIEPTLKIAPSADSADFVSPASEADIAPAVGFQPEKPAMLTGTNTSPQVSEENTPDFEAIFKSIPRFDAPSQATENAPPTASGGVASSPEGAHAFVSRITQGEAGISSSILNHSGSAASNLFRSPNTERPDGMLAGQIEGPPRPIAAKTAPGSDNFSAVTSQLRRTEPEKTVSKSFIAMIIVILGFVSGVAFSTFVVPVNVYVAEARDSMNQKAYDALREASGSAPTFVAPRPETVPPMPSGTSVPARPAAGAVTPPIHVYPPPLAQP